MRSRSTLPSANVVETKPPSSVGSPAKLGADPLNLPLTYKDFIKKEKDCSEVLNDSARLRPKMQIPSRCIKLRHFHEVRVAYHNLFAPFNFLLFWIREETKKASSHFNENISFLIEHYGNAQFLFHFTATMKMSRHVKS